MPYRSSDSRRRHHTARARAKARASAAGGSSSIGIGQSQGYALATTPLSGVVVTPQTALCLTAVFSAINVIATDVAKLPLALVRVSKSSRKPAQDDPRNRLVSVSPNPEMNGMRFRQALMGHVLAWGNGLAEIVLDGSGNPTALWPLHPGNVKPYRADGGSLFYRDDNTGKVYLPEQILHIAGLGFDGLTGYSPITLARQAIGLGIGAEQFGASLFGNGAVPKGILETPKKLSETAAKKLRESWENVHGGSQNANRTAVLEEGLTWKSTQINPDDAQFLLTRKFQVNEVARIFNLPPHKIGDYSESHRANVEESNLDYLTSTLQGWLEAIEAELNSKLLFEDERDSLAFVHDMRALMRGNMQARGAYYESRWRVGSISADEIRTAEGEDPIGPARGGDQYLIQTQYIPLDQASLVMAAKAGAQPQPPEPPASPPKPAKRYNPNHGADGKFSGGSGGGPIGGHVVGVNVTKPLDMGADGIPTVVSENLDSRIGEEAPRPKISAREFAATQKRVDGALRNNITPSDADMKVVLKGNAYLASRDAKNFEQHGFTTFHETHGISKFVSYDFHITDRSNQGYKILQTYDPKGKEIPNPSRLPVPSDFVATKVGFGRTKIEPASGGLFDGRG